MKVSMVTIWKKLGSPVEILLFFCIKPSLKLTASKVSENCSGWKMKTFPFFGEFKPIFVGYVGFRERNPTENVPSPNLIFFLQLKHSSWKDLPCWIGVSCQFFLGVYKSWKVMISSCVLCSLLFTTSCLSFIMGITIRMILMITIVMIICMYVCVDRGIYWGLPKPCNNWYIIYVAFCMKGTVWTFNIDCYMYSFTCGDISTEAGGFWSSRYI